MDGDHAEPTALAPFGEAGAGEGKIQRPIGIASDGKGNLYVVDRENNRVLKFDESGKFLMQFGSAGSANGQFNEPREIAVSAAGNIWVSELGNKRLQQFTPSGVFIRKITYSGFVMPYGLAAGPSEVLWVSDLGAHALFRFKEDGSFVGTSGTHENLTLDSPQGLATDAKGNAWLVDNGLNKVLKFSPTGDLLMQFGSSGSGSGQLKTPVAIAVAPSGNILISENLNNRIQQFQPNGRYLRKFGSLGAGNNQFSEPRGIALGAGGTAFIADAANHRITRWTHPELDAQSGVVKVEVKVDNEAPKAFYDQACAERDCSKSGELLFNSSFYSTGQHKVVVTATDGVKLTTPKELIVNTVKDATKPALTATSPFFTAPAGWVEQKSYSYTATAKDPGGYGVTSLELKIDGKTVSSSSQACPNGGCERTLSGTLNMANYKGGAHPAELIATDAAGLKEKKVWTVNVAPKGTIPAAEAEDTIEAAEETSGEAILLPAPETQTPEEKKAPPILNQDGEEISSENTFVESTMTTDPSKGFQLLTSEGLVSITPVGTGGTPTQPTPGEEAGVSGNTGPGVDTSFRPIYDGGLQFQQIRTIAAPEEYTWKVNMFDNQVLQQIDARTAEVYEIDEQEVKHPAFNIRAEFAHDAVGTAVPTSLTVSGTNLITLKVQYRAGNPAAGGAPFVYPITAGTGWEGGFVTEYVDIPDEPKPKTLAEKLAIELAARTTTIIGPPEPVPASEAEGGASSSSVPELRRQFSRSACGHNFEWYEGKEGTESIAFGKGMCGNAFDPNDHPKHIVWRGGMKGAFLYRPGIKVRHNDAHACTKDTPGYSVISDYVVKAANECQFGPKTSDGNGGIHSEAGHYLRAQAHWELGHRGRCYSTEGPIECPPDVNNPWVWEDRALELHLWPSGNVDLTVGAGNHPAPPN